MIEIGLGVDTSVAWIEIEIYFVKQEKLYR